MQNGRFYRQEGEAGELLAKEREGLFQGLIRQIPSLILIWKFKLGYVEKVIKSWFAVVGGK